MPVSVVVGGQFGSEGKGKVALETARRRNAAAVVRVGGTNSGHTGVDKDGQTCELRQLPASGLADDTLVILPPGSLINPEIFLREVATLGLSAERILVDPRATVITENDIQTEQAAGLVASIGSTGSGTGSALQRRISRCERDTEARNFEALKPFLKDTSSELRQILRDRGHVVIEGTQGFGLSLLHGDSYPKCTSRDTTAGTFVAEAGLSPLDVDEVVLVIRAFPIRVAGDSGPLPNETSWQDVAREAGLASDFSELSTATKKVRRVGRFDADVVCRAIEVNNPSHIALNHLDYVDPLTANGHFGAKAREFVRDIEEKIGRPINWLGTGPGHLTPVEALNSEAA